MQPRSDWSNTAFLYDFDNRRYDDRIKFFKRYMERTSGNILDIACGTGRCTIPLAQNTSRKFVAFDFSENMLAVLRQKLIKHPIPNLFVHKADMKNFNFDDKFGYIMDTGFGHLLNDDEIHSYLSNVFHHMSDDALYILVVFNPSSDYGRSWIGVEKKSYEVYDDETNRRISRFTKNISSDTEKQIFTYLTRFEVTDEQGLTERFSDEVTVRYYYREQLENLLESTGFKLLEYYRSFSGDAAESGDDLFQIFVSTK